MKGVAKTLLVIGIIGVMCAGSFQLAEAQYLGANVNELATSLDPALLERSQTQWARTFIDFFPFYWGNRDVHNDEWINTYKATAEQGYKLILSLRWHFRFRKLDLPEPGSETEAGYFAFVDKILDELGEYTTILVLGNEPFIDTVEYDQNYHSSTNGVPVVIFYERLNDHVQEYVRQHPAIQDLPVYVGAFTRLDVFLNQSVPGITGLLELAANNPDIDGIDIHIHTEKVEQFDEALAFARKYTDKPILVTEFSLVWHFKRHLTDSLGYDEAGEEFAKAYNYDPMMRVHEYLTKARMNPVPKEEWDAFLASRDWYYPDFLRQAYEIFKAHNVYVATYGFVVQPYAKAPITPTMDPWVLNSLFQINMVQPRADGTPDVAYGFFDDYVAIQKETK